jgi:hypothetical protein
LLGYLRVEVLTRKLFSSNFGGKYIAYLVSYMLASVSPELGKISGTVAIVICS